MVQQVRCLLPIQMIGIQPSGPRVEGDRRLPCTSSPLTYMWAHAAAGSVKNSDPSAAHLPHKVAHSGKENPMGQGSTFPQVAQRLVKPRLF